MYCINHWLPWVIILCMSTMVTHQVYSVSLDEPVGNPWTVVGLCSDIIGALCRFSSFPPLLSCQTKPWSSTWEKSSHPCFAVTYFDNTFPRMIGGAFCHFWKGKTKPQIKRSQEENFKCLDVSWQETFLQQEIPITFRITLHSNHPRSWCPSNQRNIIMLGTVRTYQGLDPCIVHQL